MEGVCVCLLLVAQGVLMKHLEHQHAHFRDTLLFSLWNNVKVILESDIPGFKPGLCTLQSG